MKPHDNSPPAPPDFVRRSISRLPVLPGAPVVGLAVVVEAVEVAREDQQIAADAPQRVGVAVAVDVALDRAGEDAAGAVHAVPVFAARDDALHREGDRLALLIPLF